MADASMTEDEVIIEALKTPDGRSGLESMKARIKDKVTEVVTVGTIGATLAFATGYWLYRRTKP